MKGARDGSVEVITAGSRSTCGYRFVKGREYLVYAWLIDGALRTGTCSRTRPADRAHADLEYARTTAAGGAPLGRIMGRVLLRSRNLATRRYRTQPMPDVPVVIRGATAEVVAKTDRSGNFSVTGLAAGAYSLSLEPPGLYRVKIDRAPIELKDIRGCAAVEASVYPDGRVGGRVTDAAGKPIRGLTVDLTVRPTSDSSDSGSGPDRLQAVTDASGRYELTGVPAGRFVVGINTWAAGNTSPEPRVFYPGVLRPADATAVAVPTGGTVELADFIIPADIRFAEIAGVIFDTDRVPVEGARVYLRGPAERDFILTAPVVTDLSGRFTFAGLVGHEYVLFAERPRPGSVSGRLDSTEPLRVTAAEEQPRLTLTLRARH